MSEHRLTDHYVTGDALPWRVRCSCGWRLSMRDQRIVSRCGHQQYSHPYPPEAVNWLDEQAAAHASSSAAQDSQDRG